jgi:hypothetical protein
VTMVIGTLIGFSFSGGSLTTPCASRSTSRGGGSSSRFIPKYGRECPKSKLEVTAQVRENRSGGSSDSLQIPAILAQGGQRFSLC